MDSRALAAWSIVASQGQDDQPLDRILIRDLVLTCSIGAYDHERFAPQRVRINVELEVRNRVGPLEDNLGNVISYDALVAGIRDLASAGHINLVETFAERIARLCLDDRRSAGVRVRVEKLDVEPEAAGIGVEIERRS